MSLNHGSGKCIFNSMKLLPLIWSDKRCVVEELVVMVKDVLTSDLIYDVVFPMRCLYRLASINLASGGRCIRGLQKIFKETAPLI